MKKITLKGIAWDHPRGYQPLRATSETFKQLHPEVDILWDIRSLKEFGDMPIEDLIEVYDLITIDHPYMGQANANNLLLPLDKLIPRHSLEKLKEESVGPSYQSYYYNGNLYAIAVDAAALVAAYREDLILKLGLNIPKTRAELLAFYKKIPSSHMVAWPLCATDLWCTFLTLCAQDGGRDFIKDKTIENRLGIQVLDELKIHLEYLHHESINWNPIQILNRMAEENEILYSPFLFGYTNYSRSGYSKNLVKFGNSPINPNNEVSTIMGGVGLAISVHCEHQEVAAAYVNYVAKAETQKGIYTKNGGQPGNLVAWQSDVNNTLCNDFFVNTMETMEKAYVRPQHMGWNKFQEQGADLLHNGLVQDIPSENIMKKLNELYQSI